MIDYWDRGRVLVPVGTFARSYWILVVLTLIEMNTKSMCGNKDRDGVTFGWYHQLSLSLHKYEGRFVRYFGCGCLFTINLAMVWRGSGAHTALQRRPRGGARCTLHWIVPNSWNGIQWYLEIFCISISVPDNEWKWINDLNLDSGVENRRICLQLQISFKESVAGEGNEYINERSSSSYISSSSKIIKSQGRHACIQLEQMSATTTTEIPVQSMRHPHWNGFPSVGRKWIGGS